MPIVVMNAPPARSSGRKPRLSDEDYQDLANAIQATQDALVKDPEHKIEWVGEDEASPTKSAAYQRAQSAVKILGERFKLVNLKTNVSPHPEKNPEGESKKPHLWRVGPRPAGEKPRKKRSSTATQSA